MTFPIANTPLFHIEPPAEVIANIIHWTLGGPGYYVDRDGRADFLSIRQISSSWRDTALTTPYLWRYLHINRDDDLGGDPYRVMMDLKEIVPQWFGRAGRGAEVHLKFGGYTAPGDSSVDWIGMLWGREGRPYKLTTVHLFGDIVLAWDLAQEHPAMVHTQNLSIPIDDFRVVEGRPALPKTFHQSFPLLTSLAIVGPHAFHPLLQPVPHASLRSLYLSDLTILQSSFARILEALPKLEELVIWNCALTRTEDFSRVVNSSIHRLVCPPGILLRWPCIILSALKYYKFVENTVKRFWHWSDDHSQAPIEAENLSDLPYAADALADSNNEDLIIDLTSVTLDPEDFINFICRIDAIGTLLLRSADYLLSDSNLAETWRRAPNVKTIISRTPLKVPLDFPVASIPFESPQRTAFSISFPLDHSNRNPTLVRYEDPGAQCSFDVAHHPQWMIDTLIETQASIHNHHYQDLIDALDSYN